jgi:hypothetical protein
MIRGVITKSFYAITKGFVQSVFSTGWEHLSGGNSNGGRNTSTEIKTAGGSFIATSTTIILPIRELLKTVQKITDCTELSIFQPGIM